MEEDDDDGSRFYKKNQNQWQQKSFATGEETSASSTFRLRKIAEDRAIDAKFGYNPIENYAKRVGYLINMHQTEVLDEDDKRAKAALDLYFVDGNDGDRFKATVVYFPYFYVHARPEAIEEVRTYLGRRYDGYVARIDVVDKEDLDLANHLSGLKRAYLKLQFCCNSDMYRVRGELLRVVKRNKRNTNNGGAANEHYMAMLLRDTMEEEDNDDAAGGGLANFRRPSSSTLTKTDHTQNILDIREHDVPYHVRVSIDAKLFCGTWYDVESRGTKRNPRVTARRDLVEPPELVTLAFDIETTKPPLKFPDAAHDRIMMISYMIDGRGYLITNREIVAADIDDFEYTPKPEYEGKFSVSNEPDERSLIARFIEHIVDARPHVIVTYNGDQFDWPFVEARASLYDLDLEREIGFARVNTSGAISEGKAATSASGGAISGGVAGSNANSGFMATGSHYESRAIVHMDCLCWVRRDSYLPVGGQSLKAVARAKLRYDPVELDAELMCPLAASDPQQLATYSVSDAVATYYLYAAYVHPFVFALATIVPLRPDEVLRKGSGTLCECILMVEASGAGIIYPNKHESATVRLTEADTARGGTAGGGHVVLAETYVGGHVEALESGVFRADIACRFRVRPEAIDALIARVAETVEYALETEGVVADVRDVEAVESDLVERLRRLRAEPCRTERPLIYHLDVGAMYPNIILTNRLQPAAIIADVARRCGACAFNGPRVQCRRAMTWTRRVEFMPATKNEHQRIRLQLEMEKFPPLPSGAGAVTGANKPRAFYQLPEAERERHVRKRLETYCRKVYRRQKVTRVEERTAHVCQKENAFYVDTVRAFRDRRYEYKALAKRAKQAVAKAMSRGGDGAIVDATELKAAKSREIVYDSLQLAHKCILNSFYGYVMRKGARWYSMEMAGIVCHTGASIIRKAREIVEQLGRPLELDTDGIWCILPQSFPETFSLRTRDGKVVNISYPNAVLNAMVKEHFTNDQYHELVVDKEGGADRYVQRSENTVFFEVDGPYRAMVLPASKVEDKLIKKRYAVFNFDGTLAELKGFEVKRRGELQLIKNFQSSVFEAFLKGTTLESCYAAVAQVADYWLDVLYSRGRNMPDAELMALLSEHRNMSKRLSEYGGQKSTSISTARRLAEFLGDGGGEEVGGGNLTCKFIISRKPEGAPVTDRAIPTAIFQCDDAAVQRYHLRRWLKDDAFFVDGATDEGGAIDIRDILDWSYYIERLGGAIQKIVTIPAAVQGVANPVPRVAHPDWLYKRTSERNQNVKQPRIDEMFRAQASASVSTSPGAVRKRATIDGAASADTDGDIEDLAAPHFKPPPPPTVATVAMRRGNNNYKRKREFEDVEDLESRTWREVLGPPPAVPPSGGEWTRDQEVAWLRFHKRKWRFQAAQRRKLQSTAGGGEFKRQKVALVRAPTAAVGGGGVSTMDAFIDRSQRSLLTSTWHILQIAPIRGGGGGDLSANFQLWAFVKGGAAGGELHRVKLRVPKIFYVNSRRRRAVETTATYARCGARHLPHGAVPLHLYRHSIGGCRPDYDAVSASSSNPAEDGVTLEPLGTSGAPKDTFSIWLDGDEGGLAPLVGGEDRDAIAGVYELETPPLFRALVHCGCACRVVDKRRRPLSGGGDYSAIFDLDELEPVATSDGQYRDYLSDSGPTTASPSAIKRLYLYHHRSGALRGGGATQRQIFALFLAPVARALLIVVDSVRTNLLPNVATLYEAERLALQQRNPELPLPPAALRFEVRVETDVAQAYKLVERALQRYKEGGGGATLLAIQAADETRTLVERMPFIAEFPTCKVHIQDVDDLYDTLQWQRIGARTCVRHYLNSEHVHHLMLGQSRYHRLPIGNVERDIAIHATDVTYARHLKRNNHVWWCSPTDRPDLGRHSGAIVSSTTTTEQYQQQVAPSYREIINSPGRYGSSSTTGGAICFELEIDALPITAILQSHRIAEYEGNASYTAYDSISGPGCTLDAAITTDGDTGAIYRRASQCGEAFRVLRQMATALMRDVTVARNAYADFQVCHLYRWLRAPTQSLFYDGALLRMVELLVRKLTLQLLAELRAMGLRVVHASSNRVVVEVGGGGRSGFFGVDDALAKVEFVLASIRDKEVFHSLDITYKKCYHLLLWKDPANYASIVAKLPTTQEEEQEQQETAEEDIDAVNDDAEPQEIANKPTSSDDDEHDQQQQQPHVEMYWHVAESITTTGGGASNDRSSALLRQSFNAIIASYVHAIYTRQQSTMTMMAAIADETEEEDVEGEFARALVAGEISQTLFRIVERTANQTDSESGAALALSFANCVCHVLRIDGAIVAAVDRLRANLHRLLRLDEYKMMTVEDGGEWGRNYDDRAYILPQVICRLCNTCRDVDLKRDVHRAPIDGGGSCWLCHNCATPYEGAAIERALLDTIDAQLVAYVLQEYRCGGGGGGATSCGSGEVKRQLMTDRCECGARLTRTVKREKLVALVRTLREIGESSGCLGAVVEVASNLLARI